MDWHTPLIIQYSVVVEFTVLSLVPPQCLQELLGFHFRPLHCPIGTQRSLRRLRTVFELTWLKVNNRVSIAVLCHARDNSVTVLNLSQLLGECPPLLHHYAGHNKPTHDLG